MFFFIAILCHSIVNPISGAGRTFRDVFQVLHNDLTDATKEIWLSTKQALNQLSMSVNMVKLLELVVIGTFIMCVPEIANFLTKAFMKRGKI